MSYIGKDLANISKEDMKLVMAAMKKIPADKLKQNELGKTVANIAREANLKTTKSSDKFEDELPLAKNMDNEARFKAISGEIKGIDTFKKTNEIIKQIRDLPNFEKLAKSVQDLLDTLLNNIHFYDPSEAEYQKFKGAFDDLVRKNSEESTVIQRSLSQLITSNQKTVDKLQELTIKNGKNHRVLINDLTALILKEENETDKKALILAKLRMMIEDFGMNTLNNILKYAQQIYNIKQPGMKQRLEALLPETQDIKLKSLLSNALLDITYFDDEIDVKHCKDFFSQYEKLKPSDPLLAEHIKRYAEDIYGKVAMDKASIK